MTKAIGRIFKMNNTSHVDPRRECFVDDCQYLASRFEDFGTPCLTISQFEELMFALDWKIPEFNRDKVKELFYSLVRTITYGTSYLTKKDLIRPSAKEWKRLKARLNPDLDDTIYFTDKDDEEKKTLLRQLRGVCMPTLHSPRSPWFLLVFCGSENSTHSRISKCLHDAEIATSENFVILSESSFESEQKTLMDLGVDFCVRNRQNILLFCPEEESIIKTVNDLVDKVRGADSTYQVGIVMVSCEAGHEGEQPKKHQSQPQDKLDYDLFLLNSEKKVDLVAWTTVSQNEEDVPKLSRILSQLPKDQEYWHRVLGVLLKPISSPQVKQEEITFVQKTSLTDQIRLELDDQSSMPSQANRVNSFAIGLKEHVLLTHDSPPKGSLLSPINSKDDVNMVKIMLRKSIKKKRVACKVENDPARFDKSLEGCFFWGISCHGDVIVDSSSPKFLVLNNTVYSYDDLVEMCKKYSRGLGNGKLQIVFINACGDKDSTLGKRLSEEALIPFVIYWKTKCRSEVCPKLLERFFDVFTEHHLRGKNTTYCVQNAFDEAKKAISQIYHDGNPRFQRKYCFDDEKDCKPSNMNKFPILNVGNICLLINGQDAAPTQSFRVFSSSSANNYLGKLHMSPISKITLEGIYREQAMIVTGACSFAYCHPPTQELLAKFMEFPYLRSEIEHFGEMGGFAYFCSKGNLLQINARCRSPPPNQGGGVLKLSRYEYPVSKEVVVVLRQSRRLLPVGNSNKEWLAWVLPGERVVVGAPRFNNGALITVTVVGNSEKGHVDVVV